VSGDRVKPGSKNPMSAKKARPKSENAMKHGAYARAVLLPHESRRDYEQLVAEARSEWCPSGPTEETWSIV